MNKTTIYLIPLTFILLLAACVSTYKTINVTNPNFLKDAAVGKDFNPHKGDSCNVCHLTSIDILKNKNLPKAQADEKYSLRTDLTNVCFDCHKTDKWKHHPIGMKTATNKKNLPLDSKGLINCATTCHNVHAKEKGLIKEKLRADFNSLCLSCHEQ